MPAPYFFPLALFISALTALAHVAGLRTASCPLPAIDTWKAEPWLTGGMAAIMLHDSNDKETAQQVRALLDKRAADQGNGIPEIVDRDAIGKREAFLDFARLLA